jgi:hypothetical protein
MNTRQLAASRHSCATLASRTRSRSESRDLQQSDQGDAEDQDQSDHHGHGGLKLKVVHGDSLGER